MSTRQPSARSRAMRAAILTGARRHFLAQGYERTTMDAVSATTGIAKMTIYRHFRSKKALFQGTMSAMSEATVADPELSRAMARLPLRRALELFGRRSLETIFGPEVLGLHRVVIAECPRFPELGRMFYDRGPATNVATLASYLARNTNGAFRPADAERMAADFMSLLRGYEHMRALLGLEGPLAHRQRDQQIARAVNYVLERARQGRQ